jgi:putative ABC transport system permease protein
MTRATLIRANLQRRLRRTILTVLGLGVALFLFVTLRTFLHTLQTVGDVGSESRLVVSNKLGIIFPLPLAYRARISGVDGVHTVSYASWFGGVYQKPSNFFANFAIDPETYFALYPEIVMSPEHRAAFMADRAGAIVGVRLLERFGWADGQTVTLTVTIYPGEHRFNIRGTYESGKKGFDEASLMFHHRYLDELTRGQGGGVTGIKSKNNCLK